MGDPINNATVKILTTKYKPVNHTSTNPQGLYVFNQLPPGDYKITAKKDLDYILAPTQNFAMPKTGVVNIDITLDPIPDTAIITSIYGKILNPDGNPIPDAQVNIFQLTEDQKSLFAETTTNEKGQYFTVNLPAGTYIVQADKRGFVLSSGTKVPITAGDLAEVNISLQIHGQQNLGTVSGLITDKNNNPITGAFVALYMIADSQENLIKLARTNKEGLYLFPEVEPGEYLVKAKGIKLS
jgi:protocatechuate 3,4-dioxygenase beta subunit